MVQGCDKLVTTWLQPWFFYMGAHATQNVKRAESVSRLGSGSAHSMAPSALLQFLACQWVGPGAHNYNRVMQLHNARALRINYNRDP